MAGGKETPRQRMIGMMYLVLTALLALNVTKTVLERFIFINESLERSVSESEVSNEGTVTRINTAVSESGGRDADVAVLNTAKEVRTRTSEILAEMDALKKEIVANTGGTDEAGNPIGIDNESNVANLMVNQKKGAELKQKLNDYAAFLSKSTGDPYSPLALDANEHPAFKDDPNQNKKAFSELYFAQTPMSASLATISQMQTEVINYETQALDALARKVGAADLKFDNIIAMVRPESNIVAAGTKYKADMFIAASSSAVTPTMKLNGNSIPVENGLGKVELLASADSYDKDGLAKKTYTAEITIDMPGGGDTTYTNTIEYFVAKPVIQVQSAAVQALYLNCGNELNIQVPALGSTYNPSFSATGASAIEGSQKGLVTVVPTAAEVKLNVSSNGNFIGAENFKVRRIPLPSIKALSGGKELNLKTGVSAPGPRSLEIKAIPDQSFAEFLPKDARYRVSQWEVTLARGSRPVKTERVTAENINLNSFAALARPGDRIVIEVKQVQRMNFRGNVENVNIGNEIIQIPLN